MLELRATGPMPAASASFRPQRLSRGVEFQKMTTVPLSPFSARSRPDKGWIKDDFPASARTGLLHLLDEAVNSNHLSGWHIVAKELRRIARAPLRDYKERHVAGIKAAQDDTEIYLIMIDWQQVYDFCERLYSHIARDISYDGEVITTKTEAQRLFAEEIQRLFEEESLGYEYRDGLVQRRAKRNTINQINKAERALADQRVIAARTHFSKALRYFHDRKKPDHENTVKEAVCAVEAAAKNLFPDARVATLEGFVKWANGGKRKLLPQPIGKTISDLYVFRNSGEGVSHGATAGAAVTAELSEYVLALAASQVTLLADLARRDVEIPF